MPVREFCLSESSIPSANAKGAASGGSERQNSSGHSAELIPAIAKNGLPVVSATICPGTEGLFFAPEESAALQSVQLTNVVRSSIPPYQSNGLAANPWYTLRCRTISKYAPNWTELNCASGSLSQGSWPGINPEHTSASGHP